MTSVGSNIRNTTGAPVLFVSDNNVVYVKPHETLTYPYASVKDKGMYGLLPALYGVYTYKDLNEVTTAANVYVYADKDTLVISDKKNESSSQLGVLSFIQNKSSSNVVVFGDIQSQKVSPVHLAPGATSKLPDVTLLNNMNITVVTGGQYFEVKPAQITNLNDKTGIPLVTDVSHENFVTYVIVQGKYYDKIQPFTYMFDIVESTNRPTNILPDIKKCEILPPVQLSTSSQTSIVIILVCVALLLILLITFFVMYVRKKP